MEDLYQIGERVFNLQRAIMVREGHAGREFDTLDERCYTEPLEYDMSNPDCIVPDKDGNIVSRKGEIVDRKKWEDYKTEYYELREWDPGTGLQTRQTLDELNLREIADDLEKRSLLA
jgi:aldehyde:ferredoxin oxidoreductase